MKKALSIIIALGMLVAFQGCKDAQMGIVYSVTAVGDANGDVDITFPNGEFRSSGKAAIDFKWSNDTTTAFRANYLTLEQAYATNDKEIVAAASEIDAFLQSFDATAAKGDYYVHLKGYVKETLTGVTISVDKEFTNR